MATSRRERERVRKEGGFDTNMATSRRESESEGGRKEGW